MNATSIADALSKVGANGFISARDVLFLRRNVFADGIVSIAELDALFELGDRAPEGDREWADFFAEAAADFYLREEAPHGYLTDEEFRTLKARVTKNNERASGLELELLIKLMENAARTPDGMGEFVASQLKRLIAERKGGPHVSAEDAALIRRFLFAAGGAGNVAVTRKEAEFLFDLNDLTARAKNDPAWTDLFVKAIANHLMAHLGYAPPSREEALARHAFMSDHSINVGGFLKRMVGGGLSGFGGRRERSPQAERNAARSASAAIAERVTSGEADWLADRIGRDGAVHDAERALVAHLKKLEAELPPKLKAVIERAA